MEALEATRLLHGSMLTNHLHATYDAAVNKVSKRLGEFGKCKLATSLQILVYLQLTVVCNESEQGT